MNRFKYWFVIVGCLNRAIVKIELVSTKILLSARKQFQIYKCDKS